MQNLTSLTQSSAGNVTCAKNFTVTGTTTMNGTVDLTGATVSGLTSGIRISGTMTNLLKLDVTTGVVDNALVPSEAPSETTVGADKAIVVDIGGTPYYIPLYDTLHG
jgi:hypothetical protein